MPGGRKYPSLRETKRLQAIARHPEEIADGGIHERLERIACGFGDYSQEIGNVRGALWSVLRYFMPKHQYFKNRRFDEAQFTRDKAALDALDELGYIDKNTLADASSRFLNAHANDSLGDDRLDRVNAMVRFLDKRWGNLRYNALHDFMEEWNRGKKWHQRAGYNTLKRDLYALGYALVPPKGKERTSINDVPEHYRRDYSLMQNAFVTGRIDRGASQVAEEFIAKTPETDLPRMRKEMEELGDPELMERQDAFAGLVTKLHRELKRETGPHQLTAYASAWQQTGNVIHGEVTAVRDNVSELHRNANEIQGLVKKLGDTPEAQRLMGLLDGIESTWGIRPGMPQEELRGIELDQVKRIWDENIIKMPAIVGYAKARIDVCKAIRKHMRRMPEKTAELYGGQLDAMGYGKPIGFKAIPDDYRAILKIKAKMSPNALDELGRAEADAGRTILQADKPYAQFKTMRNGEGTEYTMSEGNLFFGPLIDHRLDIIAHEIGNAKAALGRGG